METGKDSILAALREATRGLLFISETEAEFTPFAWSIDGEMSAEQLLRNTEYEYEKGTPVEQMSLKDFFRAVPPDDKVRYDLLSTLLTKKLAEIVVYKVGVVEKDVYIVGRTLNGLWAGLTTTVVET